MSDPEYILSDLFCPVCNYNLRGLPLDHACPECGLKIDRVLAKNADRYAGPRNNFVEAFDTMMAEREQLEVSRRRADEQAQRQEKILETWEQIATRMTQLLDRLEKLLDRQNPR